MTPEQRVMRARLGGFAARAQQDGATLTSKARRVYRDSFLQGHSCKACPRVDLPADLSDAERARRADALRHAHYAWLAFRSSQRRVRSVVDGGSRRPQPDH